MRNIKKLCITITLFAMLVMTGVYFMAYFSEATADSSYHKEKKHSYALSFDPKRGRKDDGNEATGQAAAWIFAAANFPVVLSLLLKGAINGIGMPEDFRNKLKKFNRTQKKYLMLFHYILNPIAVLFALVHFSLSYCRSSSLPEWGLAVMSVLALTGLLMKFKIVPSHTVKTVYQIHTHPLFIGILVTLLLVGHSIVH